MARQREIHAKPSVFRRAVASGELRLRRRTAKAIAGGSVEKGDPIAAGELAGMLAMKRTSELIPHCHAIGLTGSRVEIRLDGATAKVRSEAQTVGRTGVEMEALVGATVALLTVWDMVKYLEKDDRGMYPKTRLGPIAVQEKVKRRGRSP